MAVRRCSASLTSLTICSRSRRQARPHPCPTLSAPPPAPSAPALFRPIAPLRSLRASTRSGSATASIGLAQIRKGHDEIYDGWDPTICEKIEALELPNRFITSGGHRNGDMRQRARGGTRFVAPLPAQAQPQSEYLSGLNAIVTDDVLDRLDARLRELDKDASLEEAFTDCFDSSALTAEDAARGRKHAGKLALFARKRQRKGREVTMRELHHEVCLTLTL